MIIFPSKTDCTIKDPTVPDNLCIVTQDKAWMDERLMMVLHENIWMRNVRERTKEIPYRKKKSRHKISQVKQIVGKKFHLWQNNSSLFTDDFFCLAI